MFTGIVETQARLIKSEKTGTNLELWFDCNIANEFKIDQSIAHNGVCLTVVECRDNTYRVTAIEETLRKTNLGELKTGDFVNIERCMLAGGRFDGHMVQGHVDTTSLCLHKNDKNGSTELVFEIAPENAALLVNKGSVCINGVSLTVVDATKNSFSVHIIPFTLAHTNLGLLNEGARVNIEFDIVGKYLLRREELNRK